MDNQKSALTINARLPVNISIWRTYITIHDNINIIDGNKEQCTPIK